MCEKYCGDRGFLWRSVGLPEAVGGETLSESDKNPCKEIDLGVHDEIEYLSRKIREILGTNYIGNPDANLSREMIEKQFNGEREYMRNLYEEILKKKCVEMGIDPESLHVDWNSMKRGEEK